MARIQVEIDLLQDHPHQIWIGTGKKDGFWQRVEYESVPSYCTHFWHVRHSEQLCRVRNPALKAQQQRKTLVSNGKQVYVAKDCNLLSLPNLRLLCLNLRYPPAVSLVPQLEVTQPAVSTSQQYPTPLPAVSHITQQMPSPS